MVPDPASAPPPVAFDDALRAFACGGVSIGLATRDAALRPHVVRGVGLRLDGPRVVVLVPRAQAREVREDVADNGRVALVLSQPSTHRTYQLKGRGARAAEAGPEDRAVAAAYLDAFAAELAKVGWPKPYVAALLEGFDDALVAVAFEPEGVFIGTPGPRAGDPLHAGER